MSSKDAIIADLQKLVAKQARQIGAQARQIAALIEELDQVKVQLAKANKNSSNSSKSPSSDITGRSKNNGKRHWVWCISSAILTLFHIATSRSRAVLEELVGEQFKGYLNFDYFSANCSFAWNYEIKAQYCWAHLIRDMRFLLKLPDKKTRV